MAEDILLFTSLRYDPLLLSLPINIEHWQSETQQPSPYYMFPYHRDRLIQAALEFGWHAAADRLSNSEGLTHLLLHVSNVCDIQPKGPLRVKVLLSQDISITVEAFPTPEVSQWNLYLSRLPPPRSASNTYVSPLTGGALQVGENDAVHGDPPREEPWEVLLDTATTTPSSYTSFKTTKRDMYDAARMRVGIESMAEKREVLLIGDKDGHVMEGSLTTPYFWRNDKWTTPPLSSGGQAGTTRRWALAKELCVEGEVKAETLVDGEECWISNGVRGFQYGKIKRS